MTEPIQMTVNEENARKMLFSVAQIMRPNIEYDPDPLVLANKVIEAMRVEAAVLAVHMHNEFRALTHSGTDKP